MLGLVEGVHERLLSWEAWLLSSNDVWGCGLGEKDRAMNVAPAEGGLP